MTMSGTDNARREGLVRDIGNILDDLLCGKISYLRTRTSIKTIFRAPTCRVAIEDISPYLSRVLDMIRTGEMSREEALEKLVTMEMSFDNAKAYA
jgi:hypothetical protein